MGIGLQATTALRIEKEGEMVWHCSIGDFWTTLVNLVEPMFRNC